MLSRYLPFLGCLCVTLAQEDWGLIWEDEFDTLDYNKWQYEINAWGGGNQEFQMYTNDPRNSYVRDGKLFIKPTLTVDKYGQHVFENGSVNFFDFGYCSQNLDWGCFRDKQNIPPIMSARLRSYQRFSFKYGKVVVDAKMPAGDWLWPAIWFLPEDWVYGGWPRSGEIDLVEIKGNRDLRDADGKLIGAQHMGSAMHWGPRWNVNRFNLTLGTQDNEEENYADHFHEYELEWNETRIVTRVDGKDVLVVPPEAEMENWNGFWDYAMRHYGMEGLANPWTENYSEEKMAPFDQAFHLILNVAVGGTGGFFPDDVTNAGGSRPKPWNNTMGQTGGQVAFWADRDNWYPTWKGEDCAMQIKSIKVFQRGASPITTHPSTTTPTTTPRASEGPPCASHAVVVSLSVVYVLLLDFCEL